MGKVLFQDGIILKGEIKMEKETKIIIKWILYSILLTLTFVLIFFISNALQWRLQYGRVIQLDNKIEGITNYVWKY